MMTGDDYLTPAVRDGQGTTMQNKVDTEALAKVLHEAGREAVERGLVVNNLGKPFLGWDLISEEAREGRRVQARYLLAQFDITPKVDGGPEPPPK